MRSGYAKIGADALKAHLEPALRDLGLAKRRRGRLAWGDDSFELRPVFDSKANDAYSGGAFNLEFETSDDGRFEHKISGRVRLHQLLDASQTATFLRVRNEVASRLPRPPADELELVHEASRASYLALFDSGHTLERGHRFWMRFRTSEDVDAWGALIAAELPILIPRARQVPPHEIIPTTTPAW